MRQHTVLVSLVAGTFVLVNAGVTGTCLHVNVSGTNVAQLCQTFSPLANIEAELGALRTS